MQVGDPFPPNDAVQRSLLTLKRAASRLGLFMAIAAVQGLAGYGFAKPLSAMALWMSLFCVAVAVVRNERATAPYYNSFDEAAWFYLLGFFLRRYA